MINEKEYCGTSKEKLNKILSSKKDYNPLEIKVFLGVSDEQAKSIHNKMYINNFYSDPFPREILKKIFSSRRKRSTLCLAQSSKSYFFCRKNS
jgi:hypothetical protein